MYQFLKEHIENQFTHYRTIRETDNHSAIVVQHKSTGKLFVQHTFSGSAACCERLLGVRSPYLPEIFEAAEADGQVMVLEEYVQGDSMHEMLAGACFSPEETKQIALDLCRALYVLHSMNIIHRDVKPENVILRENRAVLLDFNAARIFRPEQLTDTIALGTVGYAPPEQFGFSETDVRSDIYSLGVTMNIMLTGTHPSVRLAGGRLASISSQEEADAVSTILQPELTESDDGLGGFWIGAYKELQRRRGRGRRRVTWLRAGDAAGDRGRNWQAKQKPEPKTRYRPLTVCIDSMIGYDQNPMQAVSGFVF